MEMCQRVCGEQKIWVGSAPNALRRNGPKCAAAFDYIQSLSKDWRN